MPLPPDMAERHQRDLIRFQAVIMRAVEKADAELDAAEGPEALGSVVSTLHKAGRALRQSMALEARFVRDAARDDRDAEGRAQTLTEQAITTRKAQVRHAVERLIWTEFEKSDAEVLSAELDEDLDVEALTDGFLAEPLEDHIARARTALGVVGDGQRAYMPRALRNQPQRFWRKPQTGDWRDLMDELEADLEDFDDDVEPDGPEDARDAGPAPEPPPPEPPPRPPDPPPEPYVPPWDRSPHARFPGGSGF